MGSYVQRRYRVPAAWHDMLVAELEGPGLLGLESLDDEVLAYYRRGTEPDARLADEWWERGVRMVGSRWIVERDWLDQYRSHARPLPLGAGFWADPREWCADGAESVSDGRILLRLPARRAFGTGSHESTRLATRWLESLAPRVRGARLLDLGSGSGVLSFVAGHLGAGPIVALEHDFASAMLGRVNRSLNTSAAMMIAGSIDALSAEVSFDVVVVNILFAHLKPLLPAVSGLLRPCGALVVSGALRTEARDAEDAGRDAGLVVRGTLEEGEWVAWHLERDVR